MIDIKAKVFISHSGWDGIVEQVVEALERAFGADFVALFDRRHILPGQKVSDRVSGTIAECDAALIVIDQRALDYTNHPWVFAEANELKGRAR